jgi:hypothetical protein
MNRTIIIRTFFTIIVGLVLLFILKNRSPFGRNNSSFAVKPENEITRIDLSLGEKHLSLDKRGEEWLLNGKTETRKSGVLFILSILHEMKIKSPVSEELFSKEINANKIAPVKVDVFEKRKLLKTFFVYKTQSNIYGNIMKIRKGSKPFIVYMPGFEGDIGSIFTLNELFWQPYTVFNLLPSEIESVDFENFEDPASSFCIRGKNDAYSLSDHNGRLAGWDTARVERYLSYFVRIPFEAWDFESGDTNRGTVENQQPAYRITVTTVTGVKTVLTLWVRWITQNGERIKDSDRLLGKTQNRSELFILRYFDIDPLIKKKSYFYPQ